MNRKKLMGFGQLTKEQILYLRAQGITPGDCYDVELCRSQYLLQNSWSEIVVVSTESFDMLEWSDE